jgi:hypothetical protein
MTVWGKSIALVSGTGKVTIACELPPPPSAPWKFPPPQSPTSVLPDGSVPPTWRKYLTTAGLSFVPVTAPVLSCFVPTLFAGSVVIAA